MKDQKKIKPKLPPPGRTKIIAALKSLLEKKDFNTITTSEIARTAGVTEALIYKYFKDKRDLLHQVLINYLEPFIAQAQEDVKGVDGAFNKLRKIIQCHINAYAKERIFGKILMLESRSSAEYFASETYQFAKKYAGGLLQIIQEGIRNNEIRDDLPPAFIRQVIIGGIEYLCLTSVVFNRKIEQDKLSEDLCKLLFDGIKKK